jgi:hypothetical protein
MAMSMDENYARWNLWVSGRFASGSQPIRELEVREILNRCVGHGGEIPAYSNAVKERQHVYLYTLHISYWMDLP